MIIAIVSIVIGLGAGAGIYFLIRRRRCGAAGTAVSMGIATPVRGRSIRQAIGDYKLIIISAAIAAAFLVLSMIGVETRSSILIAIAGSLTALYFTAISFWMENNPRRFESLLSQFGIALQNGQLTEGQAKALKKLRFLAVPFAVLTAYLALVPSWLVYGYLFVLAAIALALTLISYWKGWTSDVWRYVHRVTMFVCLCALVVFAASTFLNESDAGKWVKEKAADYWNKPKPATPAPVPQPAKSATMVQPAKSAPSTPQPQVKVVLSPPVPQPIPAPTPIPSPPAVANTDDDVLAEAAEAAMKAKEEALKESEPSSGQSVQANPAINRRDRNGRLKPLPSGVRVIRIPKWIE